MLRAALDMLVNLIGSKSLISTRLLISLLTLLAHALLFFTLCESSSSFPLHYLTGLRFPTPPLRHRPVLRNTAQTQDSLHWRWILRSRFEFHHHVLLAEIIRRFKGIQ